LIAERILPLTLLARLRRLVVAQASRSLTVSVLTLAIAQSAVAETFSQYCISSTKQTITKPKPQETLLEAALPQPVTKAQQNRTFNIAVDEFNNLTLLLKFADNSEPVGEITLPEEGGIITDLILGKDNWLWVDRTVADYLIEVKFQGKTSYFNPPKELPELHTEPCSVIKRVLNKCQVERNSYYSTVLNRAFVSGYPHQGWGRKKYRHLEFISGEEKSVPKALAKADFVADVPQWHGALFREPSGEALLYDGKAVTNVSDDFLRLEEGDKFKDWEVQTTLNGRIFLGKFFGRFPDDPLFLLEPQQQPHLKPIYLPSELEYGWLRLFTVPSDRESNLWIITDNKILTEVNQKIQIVAYIPESSSISHPNSVEQLADGTISLIIKNETSNSSSNYFLRKFSSPEECEIMFKPTVAHNVNKDSEDDWLESSK
jgi:hypothetical protein